MVMTSILPPTFFFNSVRSTGISIEPSIDMFISDRLQFNLGQSADIKDKTDIAITQDSTTGHTTNLTNLADVFRKTFNNSLLLPEDLVNKQADITALIFKQNQDPGGQILAGRLDLV